MLGRRSRCLRRPFSAPGSRTRALAAIALGQEWSSPEIVRMLTDEYGFTVRTLVDGLFHRIYHCDDSFCGDAAAFCRSWALNIF
jgi:hypothetical protein